MMSIKKQSLMNENYMLEIPDVMKRYPVRCPRIAGQIDQLYRLNKVTFWSGVRALACQVHYTAFSCTDIGSITMSVANPLKDVGYSAKIM